MKNYARKLSTSKKRKISSTLSEAVGNVSEAGQEIENEDPNQFQLQPFDNQELDNLFSSTLSDYLLGVTPQAPLAAVCKCNTTDTVHPQFKQLSGNDERLF